MSCVYLFSFEIPLCGIYTDKSTKPGGKVLRSGT